MKERVLAGLGAIVLIVAALVVRTQLADDDGGSGPGGRRAGATPVVACTPDLEAVCKALAAAGLIEPTASLDLDPTKKDGPDAVEPPADVDGWITWDPAPEVANALADDVGAPAPWGEPEVLGGASLDLLLPRDVLAALADGCEADLTWSCVTEAASPDLTVGIGDPAMAQGLARTAPLASTLAPDGDYPRLDVGLLDRVLDSPTNGQDPLAEQLRQVVQSGALNAVIGPQGALARTAATAAGRASQLVVTEVAPAGAAAVVLVPFSGADLDGLGEAIGGDGDAVAALAGVGVEAGTGTPAGDDLAGFLYQVRKKVG